MIEFVHLLLNDWKDSCLPCEDERRNGSLYGESPFLDFGSYDASRADNLTLTNTLT